MSIRYSVYRIHDTVSDFIARCFKRKATDDLAAARELRRLLNTNFYVALMRTPYSDIEQAALGLFFFCMKCAVGRKNYLFLFQILF